MRFTTLLAAIAVLAALAGCHTLPTSPAPVVTAPPGPAVSPATRAAQVRGSLAAEKQRLSDLFRGTPVVFALAADGSLRAEVPLAFSFDPGHATVKPPLAAVLDRIAAGQLQQPTKVWVAAPADDAAAKASPLAVERANSVRAYLISKGLDGARVMTPALHVTALVRLLVTDAAGP
jgi:outer membrane protein OmpA-like peptidoglycan-associated protein